VSSSSGQIVCGLAQADGTKEFDEPFVTRSELKRRQLLDGQPFQVDVLETVRLTHDLAWNKFNQEVRAGIRDREEGRAYGERFHAQFLSEFPLRCINVRFAGFELAAWKFPKAAVTLVEWPLANQVFVIPPDYGRKYAD